MLAFVQTLGSFIVALGILVTFHEFGHYWVARKLGVKILRFSIGFGAPVWSRRFGPDQTEFCIAAIPLGGYVKMLDEREGPVPAAERARAFNLQPLASRAAIVVAGPAANFIFAILAYWLMYMVGIEGPAPIIGVVESGSIAQQSGLRTGDRIVAVNGAATPTWDNVIRPAIRAVLDKGALELDVQGDDEASRSLTLRLDTISVDDMSRGDFFRHLGLRPLRLKVAPRIGKLVPDGAAAQAGFNVGDLVLRVDDAPITDWGQWVDLIRRAPGQQLHVTVQRGAQELLLTLTPAVVTEDGSRLGRIGAELDAHGIDTAVPMALERYGMIPAAIHGVQQAYENTRTTLKFLGRMIVGEASVQNLSGPISIAQYAGESAKLGLSRFLDFLGLVSVSLAVLNLLPIPLLDGGHLLFYLIESALRRPVPEAVQQYGQQIGLMLLLGLMGLAVYNDIMRIM